MLTDERISISVNDSRAATDSAAILRPFQVEWYRASTDSRQRHAVSMPDVSGL